MATVDILFSFLRASFKACCSGNCDTRYTRCNDAVSYLSSDYEKRNAESGFEGALYNDIEDDDGQYDDSGYDDVRQYDDGQYDDGQNDDYGLYDDGQYDDGQYDDREYDDGRYNDGPYDDSQYDDGRYTDGQDDDGRPNDDDGHKNDGRQYDSIAQHDGRQHDDGQHDDGQHDDGQPNDDRQSPDPGLLDPAASPDPFDYSAPVGDDFDGPPMKIDPDGPYAEGRSYSNFDDDHYDGYNRGAGGQDNRGGGIDWEERMRSRRPTSRSRPSGSGGGGNPAPSPAPLPQRRDAGDGVDGDSSGASADDNCVLDYSSGTIETIAVSTEERIETVAMDSQVTSPFAFHAHGGGG